MGHLRFVPTFIGALLLSGCFGNEVTPFPPGLEPLETNVAAAPEPRDGDPYPEELVTVRKFAPNPPRTHAVHARGYVQAPILDVWEALRDPDVGADRRAFREWSTIYDVEPEYDYSYVIHSVIENVIIVEYDVTWRHGVALGTLDAPTLVSAVYQKTSGSTAISDLRGSILLTEIEPDVTEFAWVAYLRTIGSDHDNIETFMRDLFAELVILSHGGELPPIDEL